MSITNSMQTGVSGLMANSTAVGRISTNIANANTDGYHRTFSQMVTTASSTGEGGAAGVRAVDRAEVSREGTLRTTGVGTDLSISGSGFFVVSAAAPGDPPKMVAVRRLRSGGRCKSGAGAAVELAGGRQAAGGAGSCRSPGPHAAPPLLMLPSCCAAAAGTNFSTDSGAAAPEGAFRPSDELISDTAASAPSTEAATGIDAATNADTREAT